LARPLATRPLARYLWRQRALLFHGLSHAPSLRRRYPAHFHINLSAAYRGQGEGKALVEAFIARARERKVPGIRAATLEANARAAAFLRGMGFAPLSRQLTWSTDFERAVPEWKVVYGRLV
jgi:ribosomal protein S18 acetylase RimI-like enzyme